MLDHIFSHLILSCITFFVLYKSFRNSTEMAVIGAGVAGLLAVVFLFPDPVGANNVAQFFNNVHLLIEKALFALAWVAGVCSSVRLSKIMPSW